MANKAFICGVGVKPAVIGVSKYTYGVLCPFGINPAVIQYKSVGGGYTVRGFNAFHYTPKLLFTAGVKVGKRWPVNHSTVECKALGGGMHSRKDGDCLFKYGFIG